MDLIELLTAAMDDTDRLAPRSGPWPFGPGQIQAMVAAHREILEWAQRRNCADGEHLLSPPDPAELVEILAKGYGIDTSGSAEIAAIIEDQQLPY